MTVRDDTDLQSTNQNNNHCYAVGQTIMPDFKPKRRLVFHISLKGESRSQNKTPWLSRGRKLMQFYPCKAIGRRESVEEPKVKQIKLDGEEGKDTQETKKEEKEEEVKKEEIKQEMKKQEVMKEQNGTENLRKNMLRSVVDSSVEEDIPVV
ncbi:uncharacterized protein [Periplaneta americana]|uniref:uncharacterized protein n=1 Tax=Periplaneta americana TaxID=6978 RepID=UPI0037E8E77E